MEKKRKKQSSRKTKGSSYGRKGGQRGGRAQRKNIDKTGWFDDSVSYSDQSLDFLN